MSAKNAILGFIDSLVCRASLATVQLFTVRNLSSCLHLKDPPGSVLSEQKEAYETVICCTINYVLDA